MWRLISFISDHYKLIGRIGLFVLTLGLLVIIFPNESKFGFEYQKGKPWMHEELIAPFDFPIYKTDAELTHEKDSLLKDFIPYFTFNVQVEKEQTEKFRKNFENIWARYLRLTSGEKEKKNIDQQVMQQHRQRLYNLCSNMLAWVYSKGIIETSDFIEVEIDQSGEVYIKRDNIAQLTPYSSLYTPKSAYGFVLDKLYAGASFSGIFDESSFFRDLNMNEYIVPNILYDLQTTTQARESLIADVSPSRGMVQKDVRIISRGEIVDDATWQILESLRKESKLKFGGSTSLWVVILGQALFIAIMLGIIYIFLYSFRQSVFNNHLSVSFIFTLTVLASGAASLMLRIYPQNLYLLPFALVPIIIRTFYDERIAIFTHMVTVVLIGYFAPNPFEFVLLNFLSGVMAIIMLTNLYRRGKLVIAALTIVITYSIVYFAISAIQGGNIKSIHYEIFVLFGINGLLVMLAYPLIYLFEKFFGFVSDSTLIELSDTNHKLLRKLSEVAPGTFQHSLQVANLAEEAIMHIGGNALLVRIGALYHDVGKIDRAMFFIENQVSEINPHDSLEFEQSAEIILGHVNKGVETGRKYGLPEQIIDFIQTHHGTSTVHYFYRSFQNKYPEKEIDMSKFTYPGPKPFSKETAVLMMADAIEAASRSLKILNDKTIRDLIEEVISTQMAEEQFSDADITYKEISQVKEIFRKKLRNIYHARVAYPSRVGI